MPGLNVDHWFAPDQLQVPLSVTCPLASSSVSDLIWCALCIRDLVCTVRTVLAPTLLLLHPNDALHYIKHSKDGIAPGYDKLRMEHLKALAASSKPLS
jgi:hypothetical protein